MKKVNNVDFATHLLNVYSKLGKNLIIREGDVYRVYTGGKLARTKLIVSLYK